MKGFSPFVHYSAVLDCTGLYSALLGCKEAAIGDNEIGVVTWVTTTRVMRLFKEREGEKEKKKEKILAGGRTGGL